MKKLKMLMIGLYLLAPLAVMAETGSALKNDTLRKEPFADAKSAGNLTRGESVEILKKQGAWLQVKTKKTSGWVRLLSVKRGTSSGGGQSAGVLAVASGRAGTGQVVSTTGVRGLSEDALKAAKFNEAEISAMESYTTSADAARQFANQGQLKTTTFANLKPAAGGAK